MAVTVRVARRWLSNVGGKAASPGAFLEELSWRGFLHQCTDRAGLQRRLEAQQEAGRSAGAPLSAYVGFDATASSLHVGSLVQILLLRHAQRHGVRPLVVLGGATSLVGDPSGKDAARRMLGQQDVEENAGRLSRVFRRFLTFDSGNPGTDAIMLNNADWLAPLRYVEMLRSVGRHFSVNRMLSMESVRSRLERDQALSFLEFNYMVLQAYDFWHLSRTHGCELQMGGSDQWGNIVCGIELARRIQAAAVDAEDKQAVVEEGRVGGKGNAHHGLFGVTAPLITRHDGKKMGKSEDGAVWLDGDLLSPYDYWQFWRNVGDPDALPFLRMFTDLTQEEVAAYADSLGTADASRINEAKRRLADEATTMLHGPECLSSIHRTVDAAFCSSSPANAAAAARHTVTLDTSLTQVMVDCGLAKSKNAARRLIEGGGVRLDGTVVRTAALRLDQAGECHLSVGKKRQPVLLAIA